MGAIVDGFAYRQFCRKLRPKPGDRLLDIGCGWGALVCHGAKHYGVDAVGVTLASKRMRGPSGLPPSREQLYR